MEARQRDTWMLIGTVCVLICLTVAFTFYRYIVQEDFAYEMKAIEQFTEDDL